MANKRPADTVLTDINFRSLQEFRQHMKRAHIGISAQFYLCGNKKRCRFCDAEDTFLKDQFEEDTSLNKVKPYYRDKTWSINMSTDGQKAHLYKYHQNEVKLLLADHYNLKLGTGKEQDSVTGTTANTTSMTSSPPPPIGSITTDFNTTNLLNNIGLTDVLKEYLFSSFSDSNGRNIIQKKYAENFSEKTPEKVPKMNSEHQNKFHEQISSISPTNKTETTDQFIQQVNKKVMKPEDLTPAMIVNHAVVNPSLVKKEENEVAQEKMVTISQKEYDSLLETKDKYFCIKHKLHEISSILD